MREHLWRRALSDSTVLKASWSSQFDGDLWNIHRRVKCPVLPNPGSLYVYRNFHFFGDLLLIKKFLVEKAILRLLRLKIHSRAESKHGESNAVGVELQLQYFGHLMWRANSLGKTLMLGKIKGRRRRSNRRWDGWIELPTQWTWIWANFRRWWRTGKPGILQCIGSQRVRHEWVTESMKEQIISSAFSFLFVCLFVFE